MLEKPGGWKSLVAAECVQVNMWHPRAQQLLDRPFFIHLKWKFANSLPCARGRGRAGQAHMILRQVRLVAPRLARRLSVRTLDTPFISDSIPVRARLVG